MLGVMAARTRGNEALAHPLWNSENVDFSSVTGIFGVEGHKGAKAFLAGSHGRTNEGGSGALAHPLWNIKYVDFSGVARIVKLEGHKGLRHFMLGVMAARTRGQWGTCPPPLELRKG